MGIPLRFRFAAVLACAGVASCAQNPSSGQLAASTCDGRWQVEVNNPFAYEVTAVRYKVETGERFAVGTVPPDSKRTFNVFGRERPQVGYEAEVGVGHRLPEPAQGRLRVRTSSILDRIVTGEHLDTEQVRIRVECSAL